MDSVDFGEKDRMNIKGGQKLSKKGEFCPVCRKFVRDTDYDIGGCWPTLSKEGLEWDREICEIPVCPDCFVKKGHYHHWGCRSEICPICYESLISCYDYDEWEEILQDKKDLPIYYWCADIKSRGKRKVLEVTVFDEEISIDAFQYVFKGSFREFMYRIVDKNLLGVKDEISFIETVNIPDSVRKNVIEVVRQTGFHFCD